MKNTINYVGWVVANYNLGDEALYKINQDIFTTYNYNVSRITDPRRQKHTQTTLVSGGTCLPSIVMSMRPTKYTYVLGTGVLDPSFYGPFEPELIARFKLLHPRLIGVRGNGSKVRLRSWGIDSEVIGDIGLFLKPTKVMGKSNKIAINIGAGSPKFSWGDRNLILAELEKVCRVLKDDGYELILIPFWKNNMEDVENLSKRTGVKVFENWMDVEATINLISTCRIFIGEKLHSLVLSAAANTPFIGLAYCPEHFDFVDSVGFSEFTMPNTEIKAEKIIALFHELINNYEKIQENLSSRVKEYRDSQRKFIDRIISDLESLPDDKWAIQNSFQNTVVQRVDMLLYSKMRKVWKIWDKLIYSILRRVFY